MPTYQGQCHCGSVKFRFDSQPIQAGLRCNCSICVRKGALMSAEVIDAADLHIQSTDDSLSTYQFGTHAAKHNFCNKCGIYTFHETMRFPGKYRINLGCVNGIDSLTLPFDVFDGAQL